MNKGTVLVTGAAGYIGSICTYELLNNGYNVVAIDDLSTGNIDSIDKRACFIELDLRGDCSEQYILKSTLKIKNVIAVVHMASLISVGESVKNPFEYYRVNCGGIFNLLKAIHESGNYPVILFPSTSVVYAPQGMTPLKETDPLDPQSAYASSKYVAELMLRDCANAYNLRYIVLRFFNVAGAHLQACLGENRKIETHLIPLLIQSVLKKSKFKVFGNDYDTKDGTCVRDYVHVRDIVSAHVNCLEYLLEGGKSDVFNVGSGVGYTVLEVLHAVEKEFNCEIDWDFAPRRSGDEESVVCDFDKLLRRMYWNPEYSELQKIVRDAGRYLVGKS